MSMRTNKIKIICGAIFFIIALILSIMNALSDKGLQVKEWNNYYTENNIVFFYEDNNAIFKKLNSTYKISEAISGEAKETDKVLKVVELVNSIVEYDDVADSDLDNAYDILESKKDEKKTSLKDMAIITRDMLASVNIYSRVGTFRKKDSQFSNKYEYSVIEYWSKENNKWIMIDVKDQGVFYDKDDKLAAIEVLNKGLSKVSYLGNTAQKDYKNNLSKYLSTYSIAIDNTAYDKKSNSYVTYVGEKGKVELKYKNKYAYPSIYTHDTKLFGLSPFNHQHGSDKGAYIILSLKEETENNEKIDTAIIGGFKDASIINKYYLNINNQGFEEVNKYKQIRLNKGITTIKLSLDGVNTVSSITLKNNK